MMKAFKDVCLLTTIQLFGPSHFLNLQAEIFLSKMISGTLAQIENQRFMQIGRFTLLKEEKLFSVETLAC